MMGFCDLHTEILVSGVVGGSQVRLPILVLQFPIIILHPTYQTLFHEQRPFTPWKFKPNVLFGELLLILIAKLSLLSASRFFLV